jgi:hypothetical protein
LITIIYAYRNRDLIRVKNSLESLSNQSNMNFEVFFVNYGSSPKFSEQVKELCSLYNFVNYRFCSTQFQPWNKSRALNSVIKELTSKFCFVADIDMIFHSGFIKKAIQLQEPDKTVYFQVGYLSPHDKIGNKDFNDYSYFRKSTFEATGLSMFPVKILQKLQGFDEFYHFWGAEDTDIHIRIKNAGYEVDYYEKEILMLHQWHPSYRSKEIEKLTEDLQITGIVQLNHQHLKIAIDKKLTVVNPNGWGKILSKSDEYELINAPIYLKIQNEKRQVEELLYGHLPSLHNQITKIVIETDSSQNSKKYMLKKLLRKTVPEYYSLKEINDLVLLQLISFYRNLPYIYQIDISNSQIIFSLKL